MKKRIYEFLVGSVLSLYGVVIGIMASQIPILVIISGYIAGVTGLYLIIFAFMKFSR